jgi:hypothetical protein
MRAKPLPVKAKADLPPPPEPEWKRKLAAIGQSPAAYIIASILLLIPCYWQPRLQAGDLSSHIYNSWLAQLIETGKVQGLVMVHQTTNILFDLILSGLFRLFGAEPAQRIAVSLAVLVFAWGAFAFVTAVAGRRPWNLMPCIGMLAYGWVFHMGFFNFYLSLGLCFFALALAWDFNPRRIAIAVPILMLAYVAHALPVVWSVGLLAFLWVSRRVPERRRSHVTAVAMAAMALFHAVIRQNMFTRWSFQQITLSSGADQVNVFDGKYFWVFMALLVVWALLFLQLVKRAGARQVLVSLPFQFFVLSASAVFIIPTLVMVPGFQNALVFIAERMSLGVAICVCALLGAAPPRKLEQYALLAVVAVFFGFLYRDERILNSFEDRMQDVVAVLPAGQRVVSALDDPTLRTNSLTHMIDRVCIGHCYSYANYEPSTGQFRIRVTAPNPYIVADYFSSHDLQIGTYKVKEPDVPLYQVYVNESTGAFMVRSLRIGIPCGVQGLKSLPDLFANS